ncbi:DUF1836 domain-containing protein [Desnuesiella massiliensis]|uniref:DUF1836 domain-containing protein n=1 Tax=Desnuesiella massiliensis TaxID=1650662 RepID=UPI0006E2C337|nr:DUF1836 domain-containing protein [Desnuesiella massiliensis]
MEFSSDLLIDLLNSLNLDEEIEYEEIPSIDLYMDQVITLFENNLSGNKRSAEDKILTKTMINNYAKDKLLMSIKNKKYSKEHIILMILIYNLKQSLSIADIKYLVSPLVKDIEGNKDIDVSKLYKNYLNIKALDIEKNEKLVKDKYEAIDSMAKNEDEKSKEYEVILLTALSLINTANIQKRLAEKIIDEYFKK